MDLSALLLRDGSRVRANGQVVAYRGEVWFEPLLPVPALSYAPGQEPAPRPSGLGVITGGVDLDRLAFRREQDGAVAGMATLIGVWRDDRLDVVDQRAELRDVGSPDPLGPAEASAGRPASGTWTPEQVEAVLRALHQEGEEWGAFEFGELAGAGGRTAAYARVARVLPGMVAWATALPSGILHVSAWLDPTRSEPTAT